MILGCISKGILNRSRKLFYSTRKATTRILYVILVSTSKKKKKRSRKWKLGLRRKYLRSGKHFFNQLLKEFNSVTLPKKRRIWSLSANWWKDSSMCWQPVVKQRVSEGHGANVEVTILSVLGYFTVKWFWVMSKEGPCSKLFYNTGNNTG